MNTKIDKYKCQRMLNILLIKILSQKKKKKKCQREILYNIINIIVIVILVLNTGHVYNNDYNIFLNISLIKIIIMIYLRF